MPMSDQQLLAKLQAENARLISLLEARGIEWRPPASLALTSESSKLSTGDKVALFRDLFRGRTDVYPSAGRARLPASPGTVRPAPTNGDPASAKSRASSVATAVIAC